MKEYRWMAIVCKKNERSEIFLPRIYATTEEAMKNFPTELSKVILMERTVSEWKEVK